MVCVAKLASPAFEPSPRHIKRMTAAIRKTWSPQVRASRAVQGRKRVEIAMVSVRAISNGQGRDEHY
jgi:hypothetical protein